MYVSGGGGIYVESGTVNLDLSQFEDNTAHYGGGMFAFKVRVCERTREKKNKKDLEFTLLPGEQRPSSTVNTTVSGLDISMRRNNAEYGGGLAVNGTGFEASVIIMDNRCVCVWVGVSRM